MPPDPDDGLALRLAEALARFGPTYVKWLGQQARGTGGTHSRLRLLHVLHEHGPQIMSAFKPELGITGRAVTVLVDVLEDEGLVRRDRHPTDRRATVVHLTAAGEAAVAAYPAHLAAAARLFEVLSPGQQRDLLAALDALTAELQRLDGASVRG